MGRPRKETRARARSLGFSTAKGKLRPSSPITPPGWLRDHKEAVAFWDRVAADLNGVRFLAQVDADMFARYCFHFAEWLRLSNDIAGNESVSTPMTGSTPDEPKFMTRLNPLFKLIAQHESVLLALEDRFGIGPKARISIMAQHAGRRADLGSLFGDAPPQPNQPAHPLAPSSPAASDDFGIGVRASTLQ